MFIWGSFPPLRPWPEFWLQRQRSCKGWWRSVPYLVWGTKHLLGIGHLLCIHFQKLHLQTGNADWPVWPVDPGRLAALTIQIHSGLQERSDPKKVTACLEYCRCLLQRTQCSFYLTYLSIEVQSDAIQHPLSICEGQSDAAIAPHAPRGHHQALGHGGMWRGGGGGQSGDWVVKKS